MGTLEAGAYGSRLAAEAKCRPGVSCEPPAGRRGLCSWSEEAPQAGAGALTGTARLYGQPDMSRAGGSEYSRKKQDI